MILQAIQDILSNPQSWEAIRRVIKTKEIAMDNLREQMWEQSLHSVLKPELCSSRFKIILIGSEYYYDVLNEFDDEFDKFSKSKQNLIMR